MTKRLKGYADLHGLGEARRIEVIGKTVMQQFVTLAVMVDDDTLEPGKADRYIRKVLEKFPRIVVLGKFPGPTPQVTTIKFGPPSSEIN